MTPPQQDEQVKKELLYDYPEAIRENVRIFFNDLDRFSRNTEMISTYLGRENEWGGMVTVPWNVIVKLLHSTLQPTVSWRRRLLARMKKRNS